MSLKLCRSLPLALKCINNTKTPFITREFLKNTIRSNVFSTESIKPEKPKSPNKTIYLGPLTSHMKAVKLFSISSSLVGIAVQPILFKEIVGAGNIPIILAAYSFIGFFTVITPVLLHLITKKYVLELSYNELTDSYTAKTLNIICRTKQMEFKADDVVVPDVPGMFSSFKIKGIPLFVDPRNFDNPEHYARMMGYDKPMDFKLYEQDVPKSSTK